VVTRESWLPSAAASAPQARALVREAASELRLDGPTTWQLMLATTEAVANAIEHGQACHPRGILVRVEALDGSIGVEVCDCGGCFPAGATSAKPADQGGRGMRIIASITDRLEILPGRGMTRVRFEKRLAAAPPYPA
jgi:anti-sigma regulatory factor (Ser/Thr protein kinase)